MLDTPVHNSEPGYKVILFGSKANDGKEDRLSSARKIFPFARDVNR